MYKLSKLTILLSFFRSRDQTNWRISMVLTPIFLIFGVYHDSDFQIPCAKYEYPMINKPITNLLGVITHLA